MKKTTALLAGGALLALSGSAFAASNLDLNVYGASAEFNFWKTAANGYMTSATGFKCASTIPADGVPAVDSSAAHGILQGVNCTGPAVPAAVKGGNITLRFSSKASYDGVFAALAQADVNADNSCGTANANQLNQRKMAVLPTDASHTVSATTCVNVNAGASDVPGEAFTEVSNGQLKGHLGGGYISRSFGTPDLPGIDTSALANSPAQPVKVPFGFFVNKNVTAKTCTAGRVGDYCNADIDCSTKVNGSAVAGTCGSTASTINTMTREMADIIFSGQATNWSAFGPAFTAQPLVVCLRHAGSGTHAALDHAVMADGAWGGQLVQNEVANFIYFNDGSGDERNCINAFNGAVGYLDADSSVPTNGAGPLKYNGLYPSAYAIQNGAYDFWVDQTVYFPDTITADQQTAWNNMFSYLNSTTGLTNAGYAQFWAASNNMTVSKEAESVYPHK
ncbi:substrate-binding domain-containing protein [Geomesophilobacter sediminis]|uniref:Substrate-binding domain-containing protein n=1 Tax=Geomesophilobacter sediminis TaxID=2798584 RepID=A0A8J7JIL8_9BACT|nr:substrate-binding domain-containing protein [Geomesophilobacter sediminis]MBJ6724290.1 substrate-binding domain-containing protein [Geomesophilobacter sediminis]